MLYFILEKKKIMMLVNGKVIKSHEIAWNSIIFFSHEQQNVFLMHLLL